MRKIFLLMAVTIIALTSCQKNAGHSGNYMCTCQYILVTGSYSRDTTTVVTYPDNTTQSVAQQNCQSSQTQLRAIYNLNASCYLK